MCSTLRLLSRMKRSLKSHDLVGKQIWEHVLTPWNGLCHGVMGFEGWTWGVVLWFVWSVVASFGIRPQERVPWWRRGERGGSGGVNSCGKGRGGEGRKMANSVWDITKFKQPKRHLNARILVGGPAQFTSWGTPCLPALPLTAPLSCHLCPAFQKWVEISNSPISPLYLWKHFFFFFSFYCHFDVVDGGKMSADNLLNGARSFKSQYLSRGGEEMEEEGAVAEKRTEQISGMWL